MRNQLLLGAITLGLLATGCQQDDLGYQGINKGKIILNATMEKLPDTRATETGGLFAWETGDLIVVYTTTETGGAAFQRMENISEPGAKATFEATLTGQNPKFENYAVFPFSDKHTFDGSSELKINFPAEYGSYTTDLSQTTHSPMVATIDSPIDPYGSNATLSFKHVGGLMRFTIKNIPEEAAQFVFTSTDATSQSNEITGDFTYDATNKQVEAVAGGTANAVTIKFNPSSIVDKTAVFYVPLPVGDYSNYTIELKDQNDATLKSYTGKGKQLKKAVLASVYLTFSSISGEIEPAEIYVTNNNEAKIALEGVGNVVNPELYIRAGKDVTQWILPAQFTSDETTASKLNIVYDEAPASLEILENNHEQISPRPKRGTIDITIPAPSEGATLSSGNIQTPSLTVLINKVDVGTLNIEDLTLKVATGTLILGEGITVNALTANGGRLEVNGNVTTLTVTDAYNTPSVEGDESSAVAQIKLGNDVVVKTLEIKSDNVELTGNGTAKVEVITDSRTTQDENLYISLVPIAQENGTIDEVNLPEEKPDKVEVVIDEAVKALYEAFENPPADGYQLSKSVDITQVGKALILDKGKTLTLDVYNNTITAATTATANIQVLGNLTIKNSKTNKKLEDGGTINIVSVTTDDGTAGLIEVDGEEASLTFPVNSNKYVNIQSEHSYGICLKNQANLTTAYMSVKTKYLALYGDSEAQGSKAEGSTITIDKYSYLTSTSDYAVYLPFKGTTTVGSNTHITGAGGAFAIEQGTLNSTGGTFTCNGTMTAGSEATKDLPNAVIAVPARNGDCVVSYKATVKTGNEAQIIDWTYNNGEKSSNKKHITIGAGEYSNDFMESLITDENVTLALAGGEYGNIKYLEYAGGDIGTINIYQSDDVDLTEPIVLDKDGQYKIYPQGHTIGADASSWSNPNNHKALINLTGEARGRFYGPGTITSGESGLYALYFDTPGETTYIYGGDYIGTGSAVYVERASKLYTSTSDDCVPSFSIKDVSTENNKVIGFSVENYNSGTAKICIRAGKFYGFDPSSVDIGNNTVSLCDKNYAASKSDTEDAYIVSKDAVLVEYNNLKNVLANGGEITLQNDHSITGWEECLSVPEGKTAVLNLNGHTITLPHNSSYGGTRRFAFFIQGNLTINAENGGGITNEFDGGSLNTIFLLWQDSETGSPSLTINGSGTYTGKHDKVVWLNGANATATLNGGTFITEANAECIYTQSGDINIAGGTYKATNNKNPYLLINSSDANYDNGSNHITITGGTFHNFNPQNNRAEGPDTNFVPTEGYEVVDETSTVTTAAYPEDESEKTYTVQPVTSQSEN